LTIVTKMLYIDCLSTYYILQHYLRVRVPDSHMRVFVSSQSYLVETVMHYLNIKKIWTLMTTISIIFALCSTCRPFQKYMSVVYCSS